VWILDTDHLTLLQHGHPAITRRVAMLDAHNIAIAIVSAEEQLRGRLNVVHRAAQSKQANAFIEAYDNLSETLDQLCQLNILRFTPASLDCYRELLKQKIRTGARDLRIASIALSINAIVVTRNQKDFARVPNLRLEDWTIDS
jgi:tRNA(fMet)-specific endonuclease VapC